MHFRCMKKMMIIEIPESSLSLLFSTIFTWASLNTNSLKSLSSESESPKISLKVPSGKYQLKFSHYCLPLYW